MRELRLIYLLLLTTPSNPDALAELLRSVTRCDLTALRGSLAQVRSLARRHQSRVRPKNLEAVDTEVLAILTFSITHRTQMPRSDPAERLNVEIKPPTTVVVLVADAAPRSGRSARADR